LAAAEEVFGEDGFTGASVAEIVRRAGVAQGTFYVYFPDKKSVFEELVRVLNHEMRLHLRAAIEGVEHRVDMERVGFAAFFEWVSEHRALYKLVREAEFVDPEIYRWHYDTLAKGYTRGLQEAMDRGDIAGEIDPGVVAHVLMGIAEFLGGRWVIVDHRQPTAEELADVIEFIRRGLCSGDTGS
jgi:AcrR family transcriptional regulator